MCFFPMKPSAAPVGLLSRALPDVITYSTSLGHLSWRRALSLAKDMATSPVMTGGVGAVVVIFTRKNQPFLEQL